MKWLPLWLAVLLSHGVAGADPCTGAGDGDFFAGAGGVPGPTEERDVRMASETVEFVESADGASWAVKAHYVFENLTDAAVGRVMLFPWAATITRLPSFTAGAIASCQYGRKRETVSMSDSVSGISSGFRCAYRGSVPG